MWNQTKCHWAFFFVIEKFKAHKFLNIMDTKCGRCNKFYVSNKKIQFYCIQVLWPNHWIPLGSRQFESRKKLWTIFSNFLKFNLYLNAESGKQKWSTVECIITWKGFFFYKCNSINDEQLNFIRYSVISFEWQPNIRI